MWLVFNTQTILVFAQENDDFYKGIIKESINLNFILEMEELEVFSDSANGYIQLNVNKSPLPHMGYNYRQNSLFLHYKDSLPLEKEVTISPYLATPYTNGEEKFDPNRTETVGDVIANVVLTPIASIAVTPNPLILFDYLMRLGILSDEPFVPKETKKEKALRIITQEVYPTEE